MFTAFLLSSSESRVPIQQCRLSELSLWQTSLRICHCTQISMGQHPHYLTMVRNLTSLEENIFGEVAEREVGDKKKPKNQTAQLLGSALKSPWLHHNSDWRTLSKYLSALSKVPKGSQRTCNADQRCLEIVLVLPHLRVLLVKKHPQSFCNKTHSNFVPGWRPDGLGLRRSEEGKWLETDTSSSGDEEVLKRFPVYSSINQALALFGWFQRTKVFQE